MLGKYSHSSLGVFRTCPRKFKFRYIDKVDIPKRTTADLYLGGAVHRRLQSLYEWGADGKLYPFEKLIDDFNAEWEKPDREIIEVSAEHLTVDDYIESGKGMLTRFYERYQPFDQGTLLGAELNLNFELPNSRFRFTAKIDRLWKREDGVVEICDYKTGRRLPPMGIKDRVFTQQMGLYQLAVQTVYPQFEQIELAQYFLRHEEVLCHRMEPEELDELAEELRVEVVQIHNAERLDDFPTKEEGHCNYCEYSNLCPAKRHRLILNEEAGAGEEEKATMQTVAGLADRYAETDEKYKLAKAEREALQEDLKRVARELDLTILSGSEKDISVKFRTEEKFPNRTKDRDAFTELSGLVRQWGMDECFQLDVTTLMNDVYAKKRLDPEKSELLKKFVTVKETGRVSVKKKTQRQTD